MKVRIAPNYARGVEPDKPSFLERLRRVKEDFVAPVKYTKAPDKRRTKPAPVVFGKRGLE